jgi:hypothetical protein
VFSMPYYAESNIQGKQKYKIGYVYFIKVTGAIPPYEGGSESEYSAPGGVDSDDIVAYRKVEEDSWGVRRFSSSLFIAKSFVEKYPNKTKEVLLASLKHGEFLKENPYIKSQLSELSENNEPYEEIKNLFQKKWGIIALTPDHEANVKMINLEGESRFSIAIGLALNEDKVAIINFLRNCFQSVYFFEGINIYFEDNSEILRLDVQNKESFISLICFLLDNKNIIFHQKIDHFNLAIKKIYEIKKQIIPIEIFEAVDFANQASGMEEEELNALFDSKKELIPTLIKTAEDFATIADALNREKIKIIINSIKERTSALVNDREDFARMLGALNEDEELYVLICNYIKSKLNEIFKTANDFIEIMRDLGANITKFNFFKIIWLNPLLDDYIERANSTNLNQLFTDSRQSVHVASTLREAIKNNQPFDNALIATLPKNLRREIDDHLKRYIGRVSFEKFLGTILPERVTNSNYLQAN